MSGRSPDSLVVRLLEYFSQEYHQDFTSIPTPEERRSLLRAIFVQRAPNPLSEELLLLQDQLLQLELAARGVINLSALPSVPKFPKFCLWQGDITQLNVDVIVNAANSGLLGCFQPTHRCIDNVIHSNAGFRLRLSCNEMMLKEFPNGNWNEPTGHARITPAFNLPCRFVIHTVGPIVSGKLREKEKSLLKQCYESCLRVATENHCRSIAFCCVSTGIFGFPKRPAAEIATETAKEFLEKEEGTIEKVVFNVFTDEDKEIYNEILNELNGESE
jgi:O-acetyl-ADP-ribose deacetylase (regulator of RNase III)